MLALNILDWLISEKIVSRAPIGGRPQSKESRPRSKRALTARVCTRALHPVRAFDSLSQTQQALKRVEEGLKMSGGDVEGFCLAGRYQGKLGRVQSATESFTVKH